MATGKPQHFLLIVFSLLVFSCSDNDTYPYGESRIDLCTVFVADDIYYFKLDNGKTLLPQNLSDNLNRKFTNGQRMRIRYKILTDNTSSFDHTVRLYDAVNINLSGILLMTEEDEERFGDDPIGIESLWITGDYLNLSFYFYANTEQHYISLVRNTTVTYPDDEAVYLEIRHNANNDFPAYRKKGIVSFDIRSVKDEGVCSRNIEIKVNEYDNGEKKYLRVYEN